MKNKVKNLKSLLFLLIIFVVLAFSNTVYAIDGLTVVEPTDEYKAYMELSDEEKNKVLEPKRYNVIAPESTSSKLNRMNNLFKLTDILEDSLNKEYDLRNIIPNNVLVRDQMQTDSCWAFAGLGMLESSLGMRDYKLGNTKNIYDFSERHMFYASKRSFFNNNQFNEYGYTTDVSGGNFNEVRNYFTNGMGAIAESDMPFENNENYINLSDIQNKNTITTLYDTIEFEDIEDVGKTELMAKMKQTISNYGGIFAGVHGAQLLSDAYNNKTGAIYCDPNDQENSYAMNHAVVIIGWDDNYSRDNFNEEHKPQNNGAWIVKNSWGDQLTANLKEQKQTLYNKYTAEYNEKGWYSADDIPNDYIIELFVENGYGEGKVSIEGENIVIDIGDNGYMYISYEDKNIYNNLYAVEKASSEKDYDNLYQHDKRAANIPIIYPTQSVYIANKFERDAEKTEYLEKIGFYTYQEVTCEAYVNSADGDLTNTKLKKVNLKEGSSITVEPGYHVLELAEPVQLTGSSFVVSLRISTTEDEITFTEETKETDENAEIGPDKSFFTDDDNFKVNNWEDLGTYETEEVRGNLSIKAFTDNEGPVKNLEKIEITTPPTKTEYMEGETFDKTGMVVKASYSDSTSQEVTNYKITDGDKLTYGQDHVTIQYEENGISKTATQAITVNKEETPEPVEITNVTIKSLPSKLTYIQNEEELDLTGGVLEVTYSDGNVIQLDMKSTEIIVTGFDNTKLGKQTITITYSNRQLTFEIEIIEKTEPVDPENPGGTDEPENPGQPENPQNPEEQIKPVLSDFTNMQTEYLQALIYLFSGDEESYIDFEIKVSNIVNGSDKTNYTYYYHFSGTGTDENINNWIKIENPEINVANDGTKTLTFKVNSKDIPDFSEISKSTTLYLYLKEDAEASGETLSQVVLDEVEKTENTFVKVYNDEEEVGTVDDVINISGNNHQAPNTNYSGTENTGDNTVAKGILPQAGAISIGIAIAVLIGIGIYTFIKHRNIDK